MLLPSNETGVWLVVGLLALVAVARLLEMASSRRRLRALSPTARCFEDPGIWPGMVGMHALLLVLPAIEVVWRGDLLVPALFWPCVLLIIATTLLRLWTQRILGPAWNAAGVIDPKWGFQTRGPYRWMRHPNYLAVALEVAAVPLAASAFLSLALLLPGHAYVLWRRVRAEDRAMEAVPGYTDAFAQCGGLLPRLPRRAAGQRAKRALVMDPTRP